jgi:two-component system, NtrC family, sensor histidine kinase KinB
MTADHPQLVDRVLAGLRTPLGRSPIRPYALATLLSVAGVAVALPVAVLVDSLLVSFPLLAVGASSWYGGFRAGVFATLISLALLLLISLEDTLVRNDLQRDAIRMAFYLPAALMLAFLTQAARRALISEEASRAQRQMLGVERYLRNTAEEAETYFRAIFSSAGDAILVADQDGRYLDANEAALKLSGYTRQELLGLSVHDVTAFGADWGAQEYARFMEEGSWSGELELRRKDGSRVPVESRATLLSLPSGTVGLSIVRDISERRRVEQMQKSFLAAISHDLRNPLTPIIGLSLWMLNNQKFDAEAVGDILTEARRLQRLIGDLLDASSMEAGVFDVRPVEMDLVEVAARAVKNHHVTSDQMSIHLDAPDHPVVGRWDAERVEQAIDNLLSNARKYSPHGGLVRLRLDAHDSEALIAVSDEGVGIEPDVLPRLFDRFYRTQEASQVPADGLGLGLYIVRMITEAHGGRAWCESAGRGKGSTFFISLPYSASSALP